MIKNTLQAIIAKHRRFLPLRLAAKWSEMYLHAWYNEGCWDFATNGEAFVLTQFGRWAEGRSVVIWDVGAHYGEWSEAAHELVPSAAVHSFEIIPEIASMLPDTVWRSTHTLGLSDAGGVVDVHWNQGHDTESSIAPRSESPTFQGVPIVVTRCEVKTGDEIAGKLGPPDFLKIDVEGHEAHVLRGFRDTLRSASAPRLIQFEYGKTYVPAGSTLREIYSLLPDYSIGRLYPGYVDFKPYSYADEHLRMGNMIATKDPSLRRVLAGQPAAWARKRTEAQESELIRTPC